MTVYRYVRTGRLPATLDGATWTVDPADLASFDRDRLASARGTTRQSRRPLRPARLAQRMAAGDEAGSWSIIEDALASGVGPGEIYTELVVPALRRIGDAWQSGAMTVADEHRASAVSLRLIGRLGPRFARRGRTRGLVVLGAAPGELHGLPSAILADLLRIAGFGVVDLGPNTPAASFADAVAESDRLVAVLVGATTSGQDVALRSVVRAIRRAEVAAPILVGGRAVQDLDHARRLGADGWTGSDAVAAVEALVATSRVVVSQALPNQGSSGSDPETPRP